jgi:hypothetical protein
MREKTEEELCKEFKEFCEDAKLPFLSADELLLELEAKSFGEQSQVTVEVKEWHKTYVGHFIYLWERMEQRSKHS